MPTPTPAATNTKSSRSTRQLHKLRHGVLVVQPIFSSSGFRRVLAWRDDHNGAKQIWKQHQTNLGGTSATQLPLYHRAHQIKHCRRQESDFGHTNDVTRWMKRRTHLGADFALKLVPRACPYLRFLQHPLFLVFFSCVYFVLHPGTYIGARLWI